MGFKCFSVGNQRNGRKNKTNILRGRRVFPECSKIVEILFFVKKEKLGAGRLVQVNLLLTGVHQSLGKAYKIEQYNHIEY